MILCLKLWQWLRQRLRLGLKKGLTLHLTKRGSIYIEASLVMPLTCLIMASLVGIIMFFFQELADQIEAHREAEANFSWEAELALIRNYERFIDWIQE